MNARGRALEVLGHLLHPGSSADVADIDLARIDWATVLAIANEHLLTPALWAALCESGRADALPKDVHEYLETLHEANGRRNEVLRSQAVELLAALNRQRIAPVLLKGGLSLFEGPYADPAVRMMRDLDLMVPSHRRSDAIDVLERLGYRLARQYDAGHHAFGDFARPHDPGSVDLHTELIDPSYLLPASEVWTRAALKQASGVRYRAPAPTDRVLHNILHAQIHYLGHFYRAEWPLQQIYELGRLIRCHGPAVDWRFVQQRMAAHRLATPLESYLLVAHRLFGLDWPLESEPSRPARLHYARCRLQMSVRALHWFAIPWGNLRGGFAWHRMRALHGDAGGPLRWRARHLWLYLRKKRIGAAVGRLLRVQ